MVFLLYSLAVLTAIRAGHAAFSEGTADNLQASSLTVERVEDALRRAKEINLLQRTINKVDRELNSDKSYRCPLSLHHGKRVSSNSEDYSKTKDALLALRILMKEGGFSPEDLQTREAISIFSRAEGMNCDLPDPGTCDFYSKYRTINGSCNNKDNPRWGMTGTIQERILKSDYDSLPGDPRTTGIDGKPLPNPRFISNAVHANPSPLESLSRTNTLLLFAFGQFLDHDIALTPESEDIDCCKSDDNQDNCFNINIVSSDKFSDIFTPGYCMEVKRSAALFCPDAQSNGVQQREQINAITSFVDASNVYGSSDSTQKALRRQNDKTFLLKTAVDRNQFNEERIPEVPEDDEDLADSCTPTEPNQKCAFAGDLRVNEVPTLTTIHFLFVLEHNRIAEELKDYYDDDETVFQETRRLLIAIMQKIVYDEFLPAIFSKKGLQKYKLRSTVKYQYEPETNPSLINSFGIAYRVGHSWIPQQMKLFSQDLTQNIPPDFSLDTEEVYFNPNMTYAEDGFARIAYALSGRRSPDIDNIVEEPARSRLFIDKVRNIAFDLCALNIQRGRDHGLPSYNKYREFCNLKTVNKKWDEDDYGDSGLTDHTYGIRRQLKKAGYSSPRDIDLFTGGISEKSVKGGSLGPTFECLIGEQFQRLKFGDRFWYQNKDSGFNRKQIKAIRNYSLSKILCHNYNFLEIQYPNAFELSDKKLPCDDIPDLDLTVFSPGEGDIRCMGEFGACTKHTFDDGKKMTLQNTDCQSYCRCLGNRSHTRFFWVVKTCRDGKIFDEKKQRCRNESKVNCIFRK